MHRSTRSTGSAFAGATLLILLLALLLAVPGAAAGRSPAGPSDTVAAEGQKPLAAGTVEIDAEALAAGDLEVSTDPLVGLTGAQLQVRGTGDVRVADGGPAPVPAAESTTAASVRVAEGATPPASPAESALADATGSIVVATLTATAPDGSPRTSSDVVWVDRFAGATLVSELGEQDLRLQRVTSLLHADTVTPAQATTLRAAIRGSTTTSESVTEGGCGGASLCVSGTVRWTDRTGAPHPVDRAPVQVRDQEAGADQVVTTVTTDANGFFSATIDNNDGDGTGRDVYVRVSASGPGFSLAQHIDSGVTNNAASGAALTKNLLANNVADNNTAFSVHAALVIATDEIVRQNGAAFPRVPVVFPADGSYFDGISLHLLALDRWDWDVSLHEFGHYVSARLGIEANPGGSHGFGDNLSDVYGNKSIGVRLAWGEGWPTYFAVSTLRARAGGLGIAGIGDTSYQDTEDAAISVDLETNGTLGEDNEQTVFASLWDLNDPVNEGLDTVTLSRGSIWDTLDAANPTSLSAAYARFSPNRTVEGTNCVFTQMNVSPTITGAGTTVSTTPPTVHWLRGNGGTHANNRFTVKFRSAGGALLFRSTTVTGTSFTPRAAQWNAVLAGAGGTVRISVVATQSDAPATGPYRSCTRSYTVV